MKLLVVLSIFILSISFSEQKVKYVNCPENIDADREMSESCYQLRCSVNKNGSLRFRNDCPEEECSAGTQIGYKQADNSLTFPDCCGGPICEEKINATFSIIH